MTKVDTVEAAIKLLGQNGLRMVLARVAFRPVINMESDGFARRVAPRVWDQSDRCALAASLIAPGILAGGCEAYLAGLMQNVGLIVAFRLCPDRAVPGSTGFSSQLLALGRQLSAGIARHWEFPAEVTLAIEQAGAPDASNLARALAQGDRIAKLRLLIDAGTVPEDDALVTDGLDSFQRRRLGKLAHLET